MSESDITPDAIVKSLSTEFIGQNVIYDFSITSTQDIARSEARKGAAEGTIVIAEEQTAGTGRRRRTWYTPAGSGLAFSLILRPGLQELSCMAMITSLAVVNAIEEATGLEAAIKWPNDILIKGRKVCGILIDSEMKGEAIDFVIIGIGVNVNLDVSSVPEISEIATSLSTELGEQVSRLSLLQALLVQLERLYLAVREGKTIFEDWRRHVETVGKRVRVTSSSMVEEGWVEKVAEDGSLLLRRDDGSMAKILAGDVTLKA